MTRELPSLELGLLGAVADSLFSSSLGHEEWLYGEDAYHSAAVIPRPVTSDGM